MKKIFDIWLSLFLLFPILIILFFLYFLVIFNSKGPFIHWSLRSGKNSKNFYMPKIRTMVINTPQIATHLVENPDLLYTPYGKLLRKYSIDELPQIYSVIKGDMSFVGPRPALFNQEDLISIRKREGLDKVLPGITGWAQVNGRDELSLKNKVFLEKEYLKKKSFFFDIYIIWLTLRKVVLKDGVTH